MPVAGIAVRWYKFISWIGCGRIFETFNDCQSAERGRQLLPIIRTEYLEGNSKDDGIDFGRTTHTRMWAGNMGWSDGQKGRFWKELKISGLFWLFEFLSKSRWEARLRRQTLIEPRERRWRSLELNTLIPPQPLQENSPLNKQDSDLLLHPNGLVRKADKLVVVVELRTTRTRLYISPSMACVDELSSSKTVDESLSNENTLSSA